MARKKIKKVSVAPVDPITGSIVDTFNVDDKTVNAPSINLLETVMNNIGLGKGTIPVISNPNLDTMDLNGFAYVTNAYDGTGTSNYYGYMLQIIHEGTYKLQLTTSHNENGKLEYRKCHNGTWGAWHTISST